MQCLLCGGTIVRRGPSAVNSGADVYYCAACPNVYVFTRGHEVEALERRARETGRHGRLFGPGPRPSWPLARSPLSRAAGQPRGRGERGRQQPDMRHGDEPSNGPRSSRPLASPTHFGNLSY
jgi:hypothetical protein